ncbi:hypothetical protein [Methyloceanibacter superfactus]|nr:hypothetical protein [Methyloceanibacter superfactus]
MVTALLALLACLASSAASAGMWYLNGKGTDTPYGIWAFGEDGLPLAAAPVVRATDAETHIAWPSAIKDGPTTRLYASVYNEGWKTVRLYTASHGVEFIDQGPVFAANGDEPYGIGPAYVMRDPAGPDPYVMYYLVRGQRGPGNDIAVATSPDGRTWTRHGVILSASLPEEAGGLSVSYACRERSGAMVLLYQGYDADLAKGVALVATAPGPTSGFSDRVIIKSWDGFSATVRGIAGEKAGHVHAGAKVPIGIPLLIAGSPAEPIVATRQEGTRIWFDRPLLNAHADSRLYSMARNKVEMSYIRQMPDGSWTGIATLYKPAALAAEYTTALSSPTLQGVWDYDRTGFTFEPSHPETRESLENPTPLVDTASCSN